MQWIVHVEFWCTCGPVINFSGPSISRDIIHTSLNLTTVLRGWGIKVFETPPPSLCKYKKSTLAVCTLTTCICIQKLGLFFGDGARWWLLLYCALDGRQTWQLAPRKTCNWLKGCNKEMSAALASDKKNWLLPVTSLSVLNTEPITEWTHPVEDNFKWGWGFSRLDPPWRTSHDTFKGMHFNVLCDYVKHKQSESESESSVWGNGSKT